MQKIVFALIVAALSSGPLAASEKTDVVTVISQFIDAFNKGDMKAALAICADMTSLIDDLPPHEWHGDGACARWSTDFAAFNKAHGITPGAVTLGKPRHVDVTGQRAYVVVPASYSFTEKGKAMKESGSVITVALQKAASGWRMTAWAWADGTDAEVKSKAAK